MPKFIHRTTIAAPAAEVFAWHTRTGAFQRLLPPWESVEVIESRGGIRDGARVTLRSRVGPVWTRWIVEHCDYVEGVQFRDVQISGPFRRWEHTHRVLPEGQNSCTLEDDITYELPLGLAGSFIGGSFVEAKLRRLFEYRHAVTSADVLAHGNQGSTRPLRILVSGSAGLIGSNLVPLLTTGGHEVIRLARRGSTAVEGSAIWNTETGGIELRVDDPIDAVVHLAGESIVGRWSPNRKRRILESRVRGTTQIADWIAGLKNPPRIFVSASAIGYYGDRGDEILTERSSKGSGFLADVCTAWESAAARAHSDVTRVASLRFGVVLSPRGGALAKMLTPFKLGGGGIIGNGRQFWGWVSVDDAAGTVLHALLREDLNGVVNVVSPHAITNREFTRSLGTVLRRPTIVPMPAIAARLAFGEMADELLLSSQRVLPERLQQTGYAFRHAALDVALRHLLGKPL